MRLTPKKYENQLVPSRTECMPCKQNKSKEYHRGSYRSSWWYIHSEWWTHAQRFCKLRTTSVGCIDWEANHFWHRKGNKTSLKEYHLSWLPSHNKTSPKAWEQNPPQPGRMYTMQQNNSKGYHRGGQPSSWRYTHSEWWAHTPIM